jgi:hypothetical protein
VDFKPPVRSVMLINIGGQQSCRVRLSRGWVVGRIPSAGCDEWREKSPHRGPLTYSDANSCESDCWGFGWAMSSRGCFATPSDFPRHDCSPYKELLVRRES